MAKIKVYDDRSKDVPTLDERGIQIANTYKQSLNPFQEDERLQNAMRMQEDLEDHSMQATQTAKISNAMNFAKMYGISNAQAYEAHDAIVRGIYPMDKASPESVYGMLGEVYKQANYLEQFNYVAGLINSGDDSPEMAKEYSRLLELTQDGQKLQESFGNMTETARTKFSQTLLDMAQQAPQLWGRAKERLNLNYKDRSLGYYIGDGGDDASLAERLMRTTAASIAKPFTSGMRYTHITHSGQMYRDLERTLKDTGTELTPEQEQRIKDGIRTTSNIYSVFTGLGTAADLALTGVGATTAGLAVKNLLNGASKHLAKTALAYGGNVLESFVSEYAQGVTTSIGMHVIQGIAGLEEEGIITAEQAQELHQGAMEGASMAGRISIFTGGVAAAGGATVGLGFRVRQDNANLQLANDTILDIKNKENLQNVHKAFVAASVFNDVDGDGKATAEMLYTTNGTLNSEKLRKLNKTLTVGMAKYKPGEGDQDIYTIYRAMQSTVIAEKGIQRPNGIYATNKSMFRDHSDGEYSGRTSLEYSIDEGGPHIIVNYDGGEKNHESGPIRFNIEQDTMAGVKLTQESESYYGPAHEVSRRIQKTVEEYRVGYLREGYEFDWQKIADNFDEETASAIMTIATEMDATLPFLRSTKIKEIESTSDAFNTIEAAKARYNEDQQARAEALQRPDEDTGTENGPEADIADQAEADVVQAKSLTEEERAKNVKVYKARKAALKEFKTFSPGRRKAIFDEIAEDVIAYNDLYVEDTRSVSKKYMQVYEEKMVQVAEYLADLDEYAMANEDDLQGQAQARAYEVYRGFYTDEEKADFIKKHFTQEEIDKARKAGADINDLAAELLGQMEAESELRGRAQRYAADKKRRENLLKMYDEESMMIHEQAKNGEGDVNLMGDPEAEPAKVQIGAVNTIFETLVIPDTNVLPADVRTALNQLSYLVHQSENFHRASENVAESLGSKIRKTLENSKIPQPSKDSMDATLRRAGVYQASPAELTAYKSLPAERGNWTDDQRALARRVEMKEMDSLNMEDLGSLADVIKVQAQTALHILDTEFNGDILHPDLVVDMAIQEINDRRNRNGVDDLDKEFKANLLDILQDKIGTAQSMAFSMDNFVSLLGGDKGVFYDQTMRNLREAGREAERMASTLAAEYNQQAAEALATINNNITPENVQTYLTKWKYQKNKVGGVTLTNNELLTLYMHATSKQNKTHLVDGIKKKTYRGSLVTLPKETVEAAVQLAQLTPEVVAIGESMRTTLETLRMLQEDVLRKLTGDPTMKHGFESNYFPIHIADFDPKWFPTDEFGRERISTNKTMLMERVSAPDAMLVLDGGIDTFQSAIEKGSRFVYQESHFWRASRLVKDPKFEAAVKSNYSKQHYDALWKGMEDMAGLNDQWSEAGFPGQVARKLMIARSIGSLGFNPVSAMRAWASVFGIAAYVDADIATRAVTMLKTESGQTVQSFAKSMSLLYKSRVDNGLYPEFMNGSITSGLKYASSKFKDAAFWMMKKVDAEAAARAWMSGYMQVMKDVETGTVSDATFHASRISEAGLGKLTEKGKIDLAIQVGDDMMNRSQPSYEASAKSGLQRAGILGAMMTQFGSSVTAMRQQAVSAGLIMKRKDISNANKAKKVAMISSALVLQSAAYVGIGLLGKLVTGSLGPEEEPGTQAMVGFLNAVGSTFGIGRMVNLRISDATKRYEKETGRSKQVKLGIDFFPLPALDGDDSVRFMNAMAKAVQAAGGKEYTDKEMLDVNVEILTFIAQGAAMFTPAGGIPRNQIKKGIDALENWTDNE